MSKFSKTSTDEFLGKNNNGICDTNIILEQFKNMKEYEIFMKESMKDIQLRKEMEKELEI